MKTVGCRPAVAVWELRRPFRRSIPISMLEDDELLVEIFLRNTDARSIAQSKSVCKRWKSLLSSPLFISKFIHHQRRNNIGETSSEGSPVLLVLAGNPLSSTTLDFLPDEIRRSLRVLDSFQDFILCGMMEGDVVLGRSFFLCNPFTKQLLALPAAPERRTTTRYDKVIPKLLACDCYNNLEQRFRVVCIYLDRLNNPYVDLFCSVSGEWIRDGIVFNPRFGRFSSRKVAASDGKLFWRNVDRQVACCDAFGPLPPIVLGIDRFFASEKVVYCDIWPSQGAVHMVRIKSETGQSPRSNDVLSLWRLDDGAGLDDTTGGINEDWTKLYEVSLKTVISSSQLVNGHMEVKRVLGLHPNKPEVVFLQLVNRHDQHHRHGERLCIFSCNLLNRELAPYFADVPPPPPPTSLDEWLVLQPMVFRPTQVAPIHERFRGFPKRIVLELKRLGYEGAALFRYASLLLSYLGRAEAFFNLPTDFDQSEWLRGGGYRAQELTLREFRDVQPAVSCLDIDRELRRLGFQGTNLAFLTSLLASHRMMDYATLLFCFDDVDEKKAFLNSVVTPWCRWKSRLYTLP